MNEKFITALKRAERDLDKAIASTGWAYLEWPAERFYGPHGQVTRLLDEMRTVSASMANLAKELERAK